MFNRDSMMQDGLQFTAEFDDGMRLKYRLWDNANLYAQCGELEIVIDGDASGKKVEALMTKLEKLGIDARISFPENAEQMYLEKMVYIRKVDHTAEYKRFKKGLMIVMHLQMSGCKRFGDAPSLICWMHD